MNNGDRLTGEIKALKAGVLYVGLDYVDGTIALQWSKIASLESRQLFIVQVRDGSLHTGALAALQRRTGGPVVLQITEDTGGKVMMERSAISIACPNVSEILGAIQRRNRCRGHTVQRKRKHPVHLRFRGRVPEGAMGREELVQF